MTSSSKDRTVTFVNIAKEAVCVYLNKQTHTAEPGKELEIPASLVEYVKERGYPLKPPSEVEQSSDEKPLDRMNKEELLAKAKELSLVVADEDTKAILIKKIQDASTAKS